MKTAKTKNKIQELWDKLSIYYEDESGFEIDKKTGRIIVWPVWNKKIKWVEMLHSWKNVFWFLRSDGVLLYTVRSKKKKEDFLQSLYKLVEKDNCKYKIIVLDNASIHKSKIVKKYCNKHNIKLVYLPQYSPDLNPIELVWKKVKKIFRNIQWTDKSISMKIKSSICRVYWKLLSITSSSILHL